MKKYLLLLILPLFFFGCSDDSKYLKIEKQYLYFDKEGGTSEINIDTNSDWKILSIPDWISVDKLSGSKSESLTLSVLHSNTSRERKWNLRVHNEIDTITIRIYQEPDILQDKAIGYIDTSFADDIPIMKWIRYSDRGWSSSGNDILKFKEENPKLTLISKEGVYERYLFVDIPIKFDRNVNSLRFYYRYDFYYPGHSLVLNNFDKFTGFIANYRESTTNNLFWQQKSGKVFCENIGNNEYILSFEDYNAQFEEGTTCVIDFTLNGKLKFKLY